MEELSIDQLLRQHSMADARPLAGSGPGKLSECWFLLLNFSCSLIECLIRIRSIKYTLITKLIAQFATNLRDESFKPN